MHSAPAAVTVHEGATQPPRRYTEASLLGAMERADRLLELFHLTPWKDELIESYSHGMRQKLLISSALIHQPEVIIIDERTVITGSYNFTARAEETNDENLLIVDDPTLAGQFMEEFERVYDQARHPTQCGR